MSRCFMRLTMMRLPFWFLAFFLFVAAVPALTAQPEITLLAIIHVTIIDATGTDAALDQTVVIKDDRIRSIGKSGDVITPNGASIVDATGKIHMPLIGTVSARGCTTAQLARVIADKLRNGFVREPHVAVEIEIYRPFFIL